jgi:hypothetical protein
MLLLASENAQALCVIDSWGCEVSELTDGFQERLAEVETYLEFLAAMEEAAQDGPPQFKRAQHPISAQQQRMLYSSVYLQLYNLVESTMSRCIETVAEAAKRNNRWKPSDLSGSLRGEWVRSTARTHENLTPEHRLESAIALCDHLVSALPIAAFEIDKGGGGNWDDSAIETISSRLGFQLVVSQPVYSTVKRPFRDGLGPIAAVKKLRNNLAHGSISFAQCAENETVAHLIEMKDATVNYLREVVDCFTRYVDNFEYILPERRPA